MAHIVLQDTLSDFFAAEDRRNGTTCPQKVYVAYNPVSGVDSSTSLPRDLKYLLSQWRSPNGKILPVSELVILPQKMSWISGNMPAVFFKDEERENGIYSNLENDLAETISVIDTKCRLQPTFCTSLNQVTLSAKDSLVIPYLPYDRLAQLLSHHFEPDVHYELLTKRALALSGLSTPKAEIIDFYLSESLEGAIARATEVIEHRVLPFVLKTNFAAGGRGTYLVRNPEDQVAVVETVQNTLSVGLQELNPQNAHLHPCSLVLTDFLPGTAVAINFYVKSDGQARFSSCCGQIFSKTNHWQGAAIRYSTQSQLAILYAKIIQETATFLHSRGYSGPVGIDVMTNELGEHYVVDLNPRPTASFILGCLSPHFAVRLAMDEACILPTMAIPTTRAHFKMAFEKEFEVGEIVILAWCSDSKNSCSFACLAVGGKDKGLLQKLCGRVEDWVRAQCFDGNDF